MAFPPPPPAPEATRTEEPAPTVPSEPPAPIASPLVAPLRPWWARSSDWIAVHAADVKRVAVPWITARVADVVRASRSGVERVKEGTKDKPRWFLPIVSAGSGFVVLILVLAAGKMACRSISPSPPTTGAALHTPKGLASREADTELTTAPPPPRHVVCALVGATRTIGPKALALSGVEVVALESEIAVGFASAPKDATLAILDPTTAATATTLRLHANDPIRRVIGMSRTRAELDIDHKGDRLQGRRVLIADPPIDVGGTDDGFGWAPHHGNQTIKLWELPQAGVPVEQVRGESLAGGKGFAIAFRQGGVVYAGVFGGSPPAPAAPLVHVDGLGATGGSPAIAVSGERVMVAWSDRASPTNPWNLRIATFRVVGNDAVQMQSFTPPSGGLGEQTMSPDLTSLGAGRFLLVWTEGSSTHQVRAAVFGDDGSASDAFAISPDGVDAGQGQAATLANGHGVVAFLSSTQPGFYEAVAGPLACADKPQ